jgi:hypothetical protein
MKIVFISEFGKACIKSTEILPRIGDSVDMFYKPSPKVLSVLLYPTIDTLKSLETKGFDGVGAIDAVIIVG